MKIQFLFKWYDLWVGIFYDRKNRWIYILPLPMMGIILKLPTSQVKKLNIPDVSNRRELLINFCTWYMGDENSNLPDDMVEIIDVYLKN